jgi:hypothetical protein
MSDVQRVAALGVFVVLGGFALAAWADEQDNPYTAADEAVAEVAVLGHLVAGAGVLVVIGALIALGLGRHDITRKR